MKREVLWSARRRVDYRSWTRVAYARPTGKEAKAVAAAVRDIGLVVWPDADRLAVGERQTTLLGLGFEEFGAWAHASWGFPAETFGEVLLPVILAELSRSHWSMFGHPSGGVVLSRGNSLDVAIRTMIQHLGRILDARRWPRVVAVATVMKSDDASELEQLLARSKVDRHNHYGHEALDGQLRELISRHTDLDRGGAWELRHASVPADPTAAIVGTRMLVGDARSKGPCVAQRLDCWLRPTTATLEQTGFTRVPTYEEVVAAALKGGEAWGLYAKRSGWARGKDEIHLCQGDQPRVLFDAEDGHAASIEAYAMLVRASFERLG